MRQLEAAQANPELKELVVEASQALARMDSVRLEELTLSCQALTQRSLVARTANDREILAQQARDAAGDMAVFARVLEATRANLNVMNRLRELRQGPTEYSESQARGGRGAEDRHGEH